MKKEVSANLENVNLVLISIYYNSSHTIMGSTVLEEVRGLRNSNSIQGERFLIKFTQWPNSAYFQSKTYFEIEVQIDEKNSPKVLDLNINFVMVRTPTNVFYGNG